MDTLPVSPGLPRTALHAVRAAFGWLNLGNPTEARAELTTLPASLAGHRDVLACRLAIATHEHTWTEARDGAEQLVMLEPSESQWVISLAYATRRCQSLDAAEAILRAARPRFPEEAILPYNLACYAAQLGRLAEARHLLAEATALDPTVMTLAAEDPDLLPLRLT
jgi:predicted Zn-dependent protease